jgi:hypothetical protein
MFRIVLIFGSEFLVRELGIFSSDYDCTHVYEETAEKREKKENCVAALVMFLKSDEST